MKTYILVEELPNGELVEAPLVLLKAQYNIYVVMGLLYTGVQKIESVGHAVPSQQSHSKVLHSNTLFLTLLTLI